MYVYVDMYTCLSLCVYANPNLSFFISPQPPCLHRFIRSGYNTIRPHTQCNAHSTHAQTALGLGVFDDLLLSAGVCWGSRFDHRPAIKLLQLCKADDRRHSASDTTLDSPTRTYVRTYTHTRTRTRALLALIRVAPHVTHTA